MQDQDLLAVEVWKDIPEFGGYQASTEGRIRSFRCRGNGLDWSKPEILRHKVSKRGYHSVRIRHDSGRIADVRVNRLILMTFVGPCPPGMVACHDPDPDKANNRLVNLRWDTQKENIQDAGRHGTKKVMTHDQIAEAVRLAQAGVPNCEIAVLLRIRTSSVRRILIKQGVDVNNKGLSTPLFSEDQVAEMHRLSHSGLTHKQIASLIGSTRPTVTRWLKQSSAKLA